MVDIRDAFTRRKTKRLAVAESAAATTEEPRPAVNERATGHPCAVAELPESSANHEVVEVVDVDKPTTTLVACPVCGTAVEDKQINGHLDGCLGAR